MRGNYEIILPIQEQTRIYLIELLVVIAIIAILAAILFPVFARARENARRSACSSNAKQIGLAILQYVQDFDEILPGVGVDNTAISWRTRIEPYIKSKQVFVCPSTGYKTTTSVGSLRETTRLDGFAGSYVANGNRDQNYGVYGADCNWSSRPMGCTPMSIGTAGNDPSRGDNIAQLVVPAETILVTEGGVRANNGIDWGGADFGIWSGHLGMMTVLFADGHVKPMKPLQTATPKNMWTVMDDGPMDATVNAWVGTYSLAFHEQRFNN